MNKVLDKEIMNELKEELDYIYSIYNEKQILGIFTYGKMNYGFGETMEDLNTLICYLPTFEEICLVTPKTLEKPNIKFKNRYIKMVDIRLIDSLATEQDSVMMEAFFSEYYIINPKYEKIYNRYIKMNKEAIFHCDKKARVNNIVRAGRKILKEYSKNKDKELLFEASLLRIACRLFLDGTSCENCINLKKDYHINYLWQIKEGKTVPNIEEIETDYNTFEEEAKDFKIDLNCYNLIQQGTIEIIKVALNDMNNNTNLLEIITNTEKEALKAIISKLNKDYEGNISIIQLINQFGISRPVFNSLFQKMKENNCAEIENQGVKGTYIKILDSNLLENFN